MSPDVLAGDNILATMTCRSAYPADVLHNGTLRNRSREPRRRGLYRGMRYWGQGYAVGGVGSALIAYQP